MGTAGDALIVLNLENRLPNLFFMVKGVVRLLFPKVETSGIIPTEFGH
jgi:hypothetical protein